MRRRETRDPKNSNAAPTGVNAIGCGMNRTATAKTRKMYASIITSNTESYSGRCRPGSQGMRMSNAVTRRDNPLGCPHTTDLACFLAPLLLPRLRHHNLPFVGLVHVSNDV